MTKKIGVFGGSFNPIHLGHINAAEIAQKNYDLDIVLFVICYEHAFAKNSKLISFENRFYMCELALKKYKTFFPSDIEKRIGKISRTYNTLKELQKDYLNDKLYVIIGKDVEKEIHLWKNYELLIKEFKFAVIPRSENKNSKIEGVSSTLIRTLIKEGKDFLKFVPESVSEYIFKNQLYK